MITTVPPGCYTHGETQRLHYTTLLLAVLVASSCQFSVDCSAMELLPQSDKLVPKTTSPWAQTNAPLNLVVPPGSPATPPASSQPSGTSITKSDSRPPRLIISVSTDKGIYRDGELVGIRGKVENLNGTATPAVVELVIYRLNARPSAPLTNTDAGVDDQGDSAHTSVDDSSRAVYRTLIETRGTDFSDSGYIVQFPSSDAKFMHADTVEFSAEVNVKPIGDPREQAGLPVEEANPIIFAATSFSAERVGIVKILLVLIYPAAGTLVILIIVYIVFMAKARKRSARWTLFAVYVLGLFALLGSLGGPLLVSSSPSTEALLRQTPVGIAKTAIVKGGDLQWAINIGGVMDNSIIAGGYSVPLFVIVLSLVGGVISMLLKLPEFLAEYDLIEEGGAAESAAVGRLRAGVFRQFMYIITAPFLGMAGYSISALAEYRNAFALSVMALAVGFVSQQIVDAMMTFSTNVLGRGSDSTKRQPPGDAEPDPAADRREASPPPLKLVDKTTGET
jgi:hypothetical protein